MTNLSVDAWLGSGRSFLWRGQRIVYWDEGRGEVIAAIHGYPTSSYDWHRIWPALTAGHRVVALDMLGFGASAKPRDVAYSVLDQADLVGALLAHLGIDRAHLLSHDYGVSVAQELLARARDGQPGLAIPSACFLNGGLFAEAYRPRPVQKLLVGPLGPLIGRFVSRRRFATLLGEVFAPDKQLSEAELDDHWRLVTMNEGLRIQHLVARFALERITHRDRWVGALVHAPMPRRFVNGPLDPNSGAHMAARYRELVPDADVVSLAGLGHYPQLEDPERVQDAVLTFLARRGAA